MKYILFHCKHTMTVSSILCIKCDWNIFYFTVNTLWQWSPPCALNEIEAYFISLDTHYDSVLHFVHYVWLKHILFHCKHTMTVSSMLCLKCDWNIFYFTVSTLWHWAPFLCIKCDWNIFYFTVNTLWQWAPFCALSVIETYFISL